MLSNSVVVATMIVQQGLNASRFRWRRIVYNFLSEMRNSLEDGSRDYEETLLKLGEMVMQQVAFCAALETTA